MLLKLVVRERLAATEDDILLSELILTWSCLNSTPFFFLFLLKSWHDKFARQYSFHQLGLRFISCWQHIHCVVVICRQRDVFIVLHVFKISLIIKSQCIVMEKSPVHNTFVGCEVYVGNDVSRTNTIVVVVARSCSARTTTATTTTMMHNLFCRLSCLLTSCVRWIPWCFSAQNICICPYLLIVACTTPQSFQVPTYRFHPVYIWGSCMRWRACITGLHWGKKIQIGHLTSGLEVFNCPLLIAPSKQTSGSCWYSLIISALTCRHKF